ncbi:tRNA(Met) cytidine acetyltransferase TmcA [Kaarinaea lacus]
MQNIHYTAEKVTRLVGDILKVIQKSFQRHCVILSGSQPWCHSNVQEIAQRNLLNNLLLIATTPLPVSKGKQINPSDASQFLGHEFEHAIIDFHDGIDPNLLGAVSGMVSGGGLLVLLLPALKNLQDFPDPEQQRMAIWPYRKQDVGNRFLQRLRNIIIDSDNLTLVQENSAQLIDSVVEATPNLAGYLKNDICRTIDQKCAVEAIEHVVQGHRRRPLVITANRGRGKSAALGIAAARLLQQGTQRIIVTGPRLSATGMVFKHAQNILNEAHSSPGSIITDTGSMEYIAPDVLCHESPSCNLLLIDEAAAIPVPMLQQLLQRYARIVFATTTYGYEGTGRGFTIKFQETLNQETPGWHALEMTLPIRWAPDDPLERFVFRCLCLDATVSDSCITTDSREVEIIKLDRDILIQDEGLLSAIFGLLILAHYQTQPRDLRYLLDAIGLDIFVAQFNDSVIATAVVEQEGGLDEQTADAVYRNDRRVMGHLLAQTLESFTGIKNTSQAKYARIVRIAVHPDFRRQGIGHRLLEQIEVDADNQQLDIAGSTFGASSELLNFWQTAGYTPVHIGLKHNTSTGTNAVTYIKPMSIRGRDIFDAASRKFASRFTFQLAEAYRDLECDVVTEIYKFHTTPNKLMLSTEEWNDITSFATASRGYEINAYPIHKLVSQLISNYEIDSICSFDEKCLLVKKVLQRQSWQEITQALGYSGKHEATQRLRDTLAKIIADTSIKSSMELTNQD